MENSQTLIMLIYIVRVFICDEPEKLQRVLDCLTSEDRQVGLVINAGKLKFEKEKLNSENNPNFVIEE